MPRPIRTRICALRPLALALSAALLAACAAQVRVAPAYYGPPAAVVQVGLAPPLLPVYVQPPCPVAGWLWTPGYWRWGPAGYFWVPGTWVAPPAVGLLWTPGYWGFVGGLYVWHAGYWGPHVGFYGGVHYGFGYDGDGYLGGRWVGGVFLYNRAVTRINVTVIHNTYNETVINRVNVTRVSYNGGPGGVYAVPTARERLAARERHIQPTPMQRQQVRRAEREPMLRAEANHGRPSIAATPRPGAFHGPAVVRARGAFRPGYARRAAPLQRRAAARAKRRRARRNARRKQRRQHPQP